MIDVERAREINRARCRAYHAAHREELRQRSAAYYRAHRERLNAISTAYRLAHCDELIEYQAARRARGSDRARYVANREHELARSRAYYARHPEKRRERDHRNRVRRIGAATCSHAGCLAIGPVQLAWQTNPHKCWMCGRLLSLSATPADPAHAHLDHVVPLARGGVHCAENLRPACRLCNQQKGASV